MLFRFVCIGLICAVTAAALPILHLRAAVTSLTTEQIASYKPYAMFARAAYCPASRTATWSCGAPCDDLAGFVPYASGGDGIVTPYWYVGYYPALASVVVGNQGTNPSKFLPLLIDADFRLDELDESLFPGVPSSVKTHNGFQGAQKRSATAKLEAVRNVMSNHTTSQVTLTGHSLGGAISLVDGLFLSINLPMANIKVVTHGMPRVGNRQFANLVDSKVEDNTRINNEQDIVPITPGRGLGFAHTSGEKHIISPGQWVACEGQDNEDAQCTIGTVSNILAGDLEDHTKLYEGVPITSCD